MSKKNEARKRAPNKMRTVTIETGVSRFAEGSALITVGRTRVLCTASVEEDLPPFRRNSGLGWITAEYSMLPRSTNTRMHRERSKIGGRTAEIQRLIGRALRGVLDFSALGERSITVDCDVLDADGGTRTAAITGGYVAMALACKGLVARGLIKKSPLRDDVAAISVGIVDGKPLLDLEYVDDVRADVDMNVVMTGKGKFIEVQGTGENAPFSTEELDKLLVLAKKGIRDLITAQRSAIKKAK